MFGPVVTTEAPLAFSGARAHSNNTAEMTAMIEALLSWASWPVARDTTSCIYYDSKHAAGVCLGTIQARTHVQLALACQQSLLSVQHRLRLSMQHVYGHSGNLGNECADVPPRLAHSVLFPTTTSPLAGFLTTLISLLVVVIVITLVKILEKCVILELKFHRYLRKSK